jgi:pSer/pThr/pTyr-binding forkhead associated (FHA) protein
MLLIESQPVEVGALTPVQTTMLTPPQSRTFEKPEVTIGRSQSADFFLDGDMISRLAIRIVVDGESVVLHDVSEHGTIINGVHGWGARQILEGDDIRIGPYRIVVRRI